MDEPAALTATTRTLKTMADGTVRLQVDIEPNEAVAAMSMFGAPGTAIALAVMTSEAALSSIAPAEAQPSRYGAEARALRQSGFFRAPAVWEAVGTDAQFLEWLKTQKCRAARLGECDGDIVPAHVRRVANGAGTGIKPPYSATSMCDGHHRRQHLSGETHIARREVWDGWRIDSLQEWCWETLKGELGHEHWNEVPPELLAEWAEMHGVEGYLPHEYRATA